MAGEGGALLAVDEEADLGDAGQVGVEGGADGEDGERFGLKAGGVAGGKGAGEVDDGQLRARAGGFAAGHGHEEDLSDGSGAAGDRMGGVGGGVEVEQLAEDGAGAGAGVGGQRQGVHWVIRELSVSLATTRVACSAGATSGAWVGAVVSPASSRWWARSRKLPEHHAHDEGSDKQDDEEECLVAGNHGGGLRAPGIGSPFEQGRCERSGDASLVVGIVRLGGDFIVGIALGGDFDGDSGAGHALDAGQRCAEGDVETSVLSAEFTIRPGPGCA